MTPAHLSIANCWRAKGDMSTLWAEFRSRKYRLHSTELVCRLIAKEKGGGALGGEP
jgi:hypothetical protein